MADYQFPQGPQFPFDRALTSGPLGDLLAGIFGVPGDISQIAYPKNDPRFANLPTAPTYQQIKRGMELQNAQPQELTRSNMYAQLPEMMPQLLGTFLRQQAGQDRSLDWLSNAATTATDWDKKVFGGRGDPPEWFKNLTGLKGFNSAPDMPAAPYRGQYP